jgi:hypothetical protein
MQKNDLFKPEELERYRKTGEFPAQEERLRSRRADPIHIADVEALQNSATFQYSNHSGVHAAEEPRYHDSPYSERSSQSNTKPILLCVFISLLVLLAVAFAIWLLNHSGGETSKPLHKTSATILDPVGEPLLQNLVQEMQNVRVFYFQFTTGAQIQRAEKYPPIGYIPNVTLQGLMDYNVCCASQDKKFICAGGNAYANDGLFMEAYLEGGSNDNVYLVLWINSQNLVEVGCWLKGTFVLD